MKTLVSFVIKSRKTNFAENFLSLEKTPKNGALEAKLEQFFTSSGSQLLAKIYFSENFLLTNFYIFLGVSVFKAIGSETFIVY